MACPPIFNLIYIAFVGDFHQISAAALKGPSFSSRKLSVGTKGANMIIRTAALVSAVAVAVLIIFLIHAVVALWKMPAASADSASVLVKTS